MKRKKSYMFCLQLIQNSSEGTSHSMLPQASGKLEFEAKSTQERSLATEERLLASVVTWILPPATTDNVCLTGVDPPGKPID
uniref:Uncharacterized protein n=1 Tax=Timema bartmani TaxID=61472 RepID=A0A7R9F4E8_9NEOP|nr:unnamed protein product [Timema bartmani]